MAFPKIPGIRKVSAKEVRELMKLPWVRDEELSDRRWDVRLLPDGRVLWYLGDHTPGTLYPSREAFAEVKRACEEDAAKGPVDLTRTLLPPIDEFLRDVGAHAKNLGKAIGVPDDALDRTEASLDVAYKAVLRLPRAKRVTPEVITPLTAYVGEVMRLIGDGCWTRAPTTRKRSVPVYEPADEAASQAAVQARGAAADKAAADVKARGDSAAAQAKARHNALFGTYLAGPQPIRYDVVEEAFTGHENEPMIRARDGELLQPFAAVIVELTEHGARGSLSGAVRAPLIRYLNEKKTGSPG